MRLDHFGSCALQLSAERVIRRQIEPGLAAAVDDGARGAVGERGRIVDIVDRVGGAVLVGQGRAARADDEQRHFLHCSDFRHADIDPGVGSAEQHVEAMLVRPLAELRRPDVGLVLVVRGQRHDLLTEHRAAEVRNRHVDGLDPACAEHVRVHAGHVIDVTDHDLSARGQRCARPCRGRQRRRHSNRQRPQFHGLLLVMR